MHSKPWTISATPKIGAASSWISWVVRPNLSDRITRSVSSIKTGEVPQTNWRASAARTTLSGRPPKRRPETVMLVSTTARSIGYARFRTPERAASTSDDFKPFRFIRLATTFLVCSNSRSVMYCLTASRMYSLIVRCSALACF